MFNKLLFRLTALLLFSLPLQIIGQAGYALFTASGAINNVGGTVITGDIGTNAGAFNGFPPGIILGQSHVADPSSTQAALDVATAYANLSAQNCGIVLPVGLGNGQVITPNVYCTGAASTINGELIFDAQNNPNAIFIVKVNGALASSTNAKITLINGATCTNVIFQVNGAVSLGVNSVFKGTIIAAGALNFLLNASLTGRAFTTAGAINLNTNNVVIGVQPVLPVATASGSTSICAGSSITLSGNNNGGTWSTGETTSSITVSTAGDYFITNSNACGTLTSNHIIVTLKTSPTILVTAAPTTCGKNNGSILVTTNATTPIYAWSVAGVTGSNPQNLASGNYTVTVTDGLTGCFVTASTTIGVSTNITASAIATPTTCGKNNGSILVATNANSPIITWNVAGVTGSNPTNLASGNYTVTVTDGLSGCFITASATIGASSNITATILATPTTCGKNNGSILVTTNASSPIYAWNVVGVLGSNPTNLPSGNYTVTVTDGLTGCTVTAGVTIGNSIGITATAVATPTTCGKSNGSILVTTNANSPIYTWSVLGVIGSNPMNLPSGNYSVTITDGLTGCIAIASATIGASSNIIATAAATPATCGINNGSILVTTNANSPIYAWNVVGVVGSNPKNLASGSYTVTVTDGLTGCFVTATAIIGNSSDITATAVATPTTCGKNNGSILVTTNATSPIFTWSVVGVIGSNPMNLASGSYTVTVTDGLTGCTFIVNATIGASINILANAVATPTTCGKNNGSILVTTNATLPIFTWSVAGVIGINPINLASGNYTVTVTDGITGCTAIASATIGNSINIIATAVATPATCGINNGSILVTTNANSPIYGWNVVGVVGSNPKNLASGNYSVTVTDGLTGCSAIANATIGNSSNITASAVATPTTCGKNNGSILVTTNATSPIFTWSVVGVIGSNPINLASGNYTVTVTDGLTGCIFIVNATIGGSINILASAVATPTTCGKNNGSILVTTNATSPIITWSVAGVIGINPINLASGNYTVTITDGLTGCSAIASATIGGSINITASAVATAVTCGVNNGSILVTTNATSPIYAWSVAGITGSNPKNLASGNYTVTVTDGLTGCTAIASATIGNSSNITATAVATPTTCGKNNGSILVTTNATSPIFSWSVVGVTGSNPINLASGNYTITVTDGLTGCIFIVSATIGNSSNITANAVATQVTCGKTNGSILVTTNATSPIFTWSVAGVTGSNPIGLASGIYTVTVTDGLTGCFVIASATIGNSSNITANAVATPVNCGKNNGSILVTTNATLPIFTWSVVGVTGSNPTGLASGIYTVTVTDGLTGCSVIATATIGNSSNITASAVATPVTCGKNNGSILVTTNATSPVFTWSVVGVTGSNPQNLASGIYTVTVTDGVTGCAFIVSATIGNSSNITAIAVPTPVTCGKNNGSILVTTNAISPIFTWSVVGVTGSNPTGLASGIYTVTVTDGLTGCSVIATATIGNSSNITASAVATPATCGKNNGSILVTTNATSPIYAWSVAGVTGSNPKNLASEIYTVTVTDGITGCFFVVSATIGNSSNITASAVATPTTCGVNNGSILVTTNATSPIYAWSVAGITGNNPKNLPAGFYSVTVTDGSTGCIFIVSATILGNQPTPCNITSTGSICQGRFAQLCVQSGGLKYAWSTGDNTNCIAITAVGNYSVTVTDASGCVSVCSKQVLDTTPKCTFNATITVVANVDCYGSASGSVMANAVGGMAPFTYIWSNNYHEKIIEHLVAGTYSVTITDKNCCTAVATITIVDVLCENITEPGTISGDQTFCKQSDLQPITEVKPATGGSGDIVYMWMYSTVEGAFDQSHYQLVPGSGNTKTLSVFPNIAVKTYFVRCVSRKGCCNFRESNIITKFPTVNTLILGEKTFCLNTPVNFSTPTNGSGASYFWTATNATSTSSNSNIFSTRFISAGLQTVNVTVSKNGCVGEFTKYINAINCLSASGSLFDFTVQSKNTKSIDVNWKTANEVMASNYEVEYSDNGNNFVMMAKIPSQNGTTNNYAYEFADPKMGRNFFRIKHNEENGDISYSDIRQAIIATQQGELITYPNPTANKLYVELLSTASQDGTLDVFNAIGKLMVRQYFDKGQNRYEVDMSNLSPGTFILKITTADGETQTAKVNKL